MVLVGFYSYLFIICCFVVLFVYGIVRVGCCVLIVYFGFVFVCFSLVGYSDYV